MRPLFSSSRWPDVLVQSDGTVGRSNSVYVSTFKRGETDVIRARFRMALSEDLWVYEVSTSFPEATLRLLTGVPRGDHALELGEVQAENPSAVTDVISSHPDITAYDKLYAGERRVIARYKANERGLYEFLWESSLPPEFPVIAENGEMEFDVTATQQQFEAFGQVLDETGRQYELLTLVHTDDRDNLLTDRQRECLIVAQREGYFQVPRECTLEDIADTLDVDKSTASETIRRGTARVVGQFFLDRN